MKKSLIGGISAFTIVIIIAITFTSSSDVKEKANVVYHITLADPNLYEEGIFTDVFDIERGDYRFRFTPSGDSPKTLSISLKGDSFTFSEEFGLEGIRHDTEISVYYTWDYLGIKKIQIPEQQELRIKINPHGNLLGPVSVDLIHE